MALVKSAIKDASTPGDHSNLANGSVSNATLLSLKEIKQLTDIRRVVEALRILNDAETAVDRELDDLLEARPALEAQLDRLEDVKPQTLRLQNDCTRLVETITKTSQLAEGISGKVRQLDLEQSRVKEAIQHVEDIQELKVCVSKVQEAMQKKDYETAADHIHRSTKLDRKVLEGNVGDYDPSSGSHRNAGVILNEAQQQLADIIAQDFEVAASNGDENKVNRLFGLFPLIGKTNVGLDKFARYVCSSISARVQSNMQNAASAPLFFAGTLTQLLDHAASIIDERLSGVCDDYYGRGYVLRVYERLQEECDRQAKIIIDTFMDERQIMRKLHDIKNSDPQRRSPQRNPSTGETSVDAREVDVILTEISKMRHHAQLFERFLQTRAKPCMEALEEQNAVAQVLLPVEPGKFNENGMLKTSGTTKLMRELMGHYLFLEEFFLRKSIEKAIRIDEYEEGNLTSTCVDDTFYIVKKCSNRALSTSDADTVCGIHGILSRILDVAYVNVFQQKIAAIMGGSDTRDSRIGYMILLNNIQISCDYTLKLVEDLQIDVDRIFKHATLTIRDKIQASFGLLTEAVDRFQRILKTASEQLFNQAIRPKLRPLLIESLRDIKYLLTDDDYTEQEDTAVFAGRFNSGFDKLVRLYQMTLSEENYDQLMVLALDCITKEWEKLLLQQPAKFNALGGLRFDKDFRAVSSHLSSLTALWSSRDRFARLQQISTLLNLEELSEIHEFYGPKAASSVSWLLSVAEIRKVLALRADFRPDDIAKLQL